MKELLIAVFFALILIPIFHLFASVKPGLFSTGLFFLLMVPTLMTLVNGAPFVPTPMEAVKKMLRLAGIKKGDVVYDIGCGDGRMVYVAANEYGASATGLELSPLVYFFARVRKLIWRSKARILFRNFKNQSFRGADVIVCYLLPETLEKLRPKLEAELKPGARIVSYAFEMKGWQPAHKEEKDAARNISPIWIYKR